jgi:cytosine/uracil/thiamine/allantoin permease
MVLSPIQGQQYGGFKIMTLVACIIPFVIGVFVFRLAFLNFYKEKYPTSTLFGVIAAFFMLCSLPWFQGFAKTWFVSNINSKLRVLGEQIDEVQTGGAIEHRRRVVLQL